MIRIMSYHAVHVPQFAVFAGEKPGDPMPQLVPVTGEVVMEQETAEGKRRFLMTYVYRGKGSKVIAEFERDFVGFSAVNDPGPWVEACGDRRRAMAAADEEAKRSKIILPPSQLKTPLIK